MAIDNDARGLAGAALGAANLASEGLDNLASSPSVGQTPGIALYQSSGNTFYWMCKKAGGGGLLVQLDKTQITSTDSLGGSSGILRPTKVYDLVQAAAYRTHSAQSGTWSTTTIGASTMGLSGVTAQSTSGGASFVAQTTSTINDTIDYIVTPDTFGQVPIMFLSGNGTGSVNITVVETGETVVSGLKTARVGASSNPFVYIARTRHSEQITLRITNAEAKTINIMGAQWYYVGDPTANTTKAKYNAWVYWRTSNHYSDSYGASDYAIREVASNKWGGSYHGGQTVSSLSVTLEGRPVDVSDSIRMGSGFIVDQVSTIDWTPAGGTGLITVRQRCAYLSDGVEDQTISMNGNVVASKFYTLMNTTYNTFNRVLVPLAVDVSADGDYSLGRTGCIVQENTTTRQKVFTYSSSRDGAYIRQDAASNYAKAYGGPSTDVDPQNVNITNIAWHQKRVFCA